MVAAQSTAYLGHVYAAWRRAIWHWYTLICVSSIDALAAPLSPCKILRRGGHKVEVAPTRWAPRWKLCQPPVWGTPTLRGGAPLCIGVHLYVLHQLTHPRHPHLPPRFGERGVTKWWCPLPPWDLTDLTGLSVHRLFDMLIRSAVAHHWALLFIKRHLTH